MYLNLLNNESKHYNTDIEPKHTMYLNNQISIDGEVSNIIEPKHTMYLNVNETILYLDPP